jgi:hypothetical protein
MSRPTPDSAVLRDEISAESGTARSPPNLGGLLALEASSSPRPTPDSATGLVAVEGSPAAAALGLRGFGTLLGLEFDLNRLEVRVRLVEGRLGRLESLNRVEPEFPDVRCVRDGIFTCAPAPRSP